jgi:class 3 adenylate cyclase/lipopolysaccharide biosynthesis regulator YciM
LFHRSDPDSAIKYSKESIILAEKSGYREGQAVALKNLGLGYHNLGDYVEASMQWERSLTLFESIGDEPGAANILCNLGAIYSMSADEARALEYFLEALKIAEEYGDSIRMATVLLNIGTIYSSKSATRKEALQNYKQALEIFRSLDNTVGIGFCIFNLGETHFQENEYDSALYYFEKSLEIYEDTIDIVISLNYIGNVYAAKGNYQTAIHNQERALEMAIKSNAKLEIAQIYLGMANTYILQENLNQAIKFFELAKNIAEEIGSNYEVKDAYEGLATAYSKIPNFENAYRYQSMLREIERKIYNIETDERIENELFSYQLAKKEDEIALLEQQAEIEQLTAKRQRIVIIATSSTGILLLILAMVLYNRFKFSQKTKKIIEEEKDRSENLLLNILPAKTAEELKMKGKAKARRFENVTILFTDFKEFTKIAADVDPEILVKEINRCYKKFDEIVTQYGIEKIKTIGDAYMAAGGLPVPNNTHAEDVMKAAIDIRDFMLAYKEERKKNNKLFFEIRIGVHSGPVVAGIVGTKKFAYDIWGDTVNIAAHLESFSEPGKINTSECTYNLIKDHYKCSYRGEIEAKHGRKIRMYFVGEKIRETITDSHELIG